MRGHDTQAGSDAESKAKAKGGSAKDKSARGESRTRVATSGAVGEIVMPSSALDADMKFFGGTLGFRLDRIFPADNPAVAVMSGHGVRIRLDTTVPKGAPVPELRLYVDDPDSIANDKGGDHRAERGACPCRQARRTACHSKDRAQLYRAPPCRQGALGDRARRYAVPRPHSRQAWRFDHRKSHTHPRRRSGARHGALPYRRVSAHILHRGVG